MKLDDVLEIRKGAKGVRGVPDGSGPEGKGPSGRRMGGCPKREDFNKRSDYLKAYKKWQSENEEITIKKAFKLRKAKKYLKRTGSPGHYKYIYKEKKLKEALVERTAKKEAGGKTRVTGKKYAQKQFDTYGVSAMEKIIARNKKNKFESNFELGMLEFAKEKIKQYKEQEHTPTRKEKQKLPESKERFTDRMKDFMQGFNE